MGEYNQDVAKSSTMNSNGEQFSGALGRAVITQINVMRTNMFDDYCKKTIGDKPATAEQDMAIGCVARVLNRLGADIKRENGVLCTLLGITLAKRLNYEIISKPDAFTGLKFIINHLYYSEFRSTGRRIPNHLIVRSPSPSAFTWIR